MGSQTTGACAGPSRAFFPDDPPITALRNRSAFNILPLLLLTTIASVSVSRTVPEAKRPSDATTTTWGGTLKRRKPAQADGSGAQEPNRFVVEPLDPWLMCGPDTAVQELWRAREQTGREVVYHLVFFDRYGWYCEHGRSCAAVAEVRRAVREMRAAIAATRHRTATRRSRKKR